MSCGHRRSWLATRHWVVVLTVLCGLFSGLGGVTRPTSAALLTSDVINAAIQTDPALATATISWQERAGPWIFGAISAPPTEPHGAPNGRLFLAHQQDLTWHVEFQYTAGFRHLLPNAPGSLVPVALRSTLSAVPDAIQQSSEVTDPPALALPWQVGEVWELVGGPHPFLRELDVANSSWGNLDFTADEGIVRAAHDGVVSRTCGSDQVRIIGDDGWETDYYHLQNITVQTGDVVRTGDPLGRVGMGTACGGVARSPHVHFGLYYHGVLQQIEGISIGGWRVERSNTPYAGCMTRDGVRTCASLGPVPNDGTIGQDPTPQEPPSSLSTADFCVSADEQVVLDDLNRRREQSNLPPLVMGTALHAAAVHHSQVNAPENSVEFDVLADGTPVGAAASAYGVTHLQFGWITAFPTYEDINELINYLHGTSVYNDILREEIVSVGIGHAFDSNAEYQHFWTLYFGEANETPARGCGTPAPSSTPTTEPTTHVSADPPYDASVTTIGPLLGIQSDCASIEVTELAAEVNRDRRAAGKPAFPLGRQLSEVAKLHVADGPRTGTLESQVLSDGTTSESLVASFGFTNGGAWTAWGSTETDPIESFRASGFWTSWVTADNVNTIGIGYLYDVPSQTHYWILYFADGDDEPLPPCDDTTRLSAETRYDASITRVVDPGTLRLRLDGEGVTVSLAGVSAGTDDGDSASCVADDAVAYLQSLLARGEVEVSIVPRSAEDRGRREGYVWITRDGHRQLVNELLLREGLATTRPVTTASPNLAQLFSAQAEARAFERGLWSSDC